MLRELKQLALGHTARLIQQDPKLKFRSDPTGSVQLYRNLIIDPTIHELTDLGQVI